MRLLRRRKQQLYHIIIVYFGGMTQTVTVVASDRKTAEKRALKRTKGAIGIRRPI